MARLDDIPQPTRDVVASVPCPDFGGTPFVSGPPLRERRIAVVSSAALIGRGDEPFAVGSAECRPIPAGDALISHVSINFDRAGFQRDPNVVLPLDRLWEMADEGVIGTVADKHWTVMGSTDPAGIAAAADRMAAGMRAEGVDSVLLAPV